MTITIDTADTLGDVVIRISHAELAQLILRMFEKRLGHDLHLSTETPEQFAAGICAHMEDVDENTGYTAIEGFLATLGCDYLIQDTNIPDRVEAHLAAQAAKASNVVPIRAPSYDDATTEEFVASFLDQCWAEENEAAA